MPDNEKMIIFTPRHSNNLLKFFAHQNFSGSLRLGWRNARSLVQAAGALVPPLLKHKHQTQIHKHTTTNTQQQQEKKHLEKYKKRNTKTKTQNKQKK